MDGSVIIPDEVDAIELPIRDGNPNRYYAVRHTGRGICGMCDLLKDYRAEPDPTVVDLRDGMGLKVDYGICPRHRRMYYKERV